MKHKIPLILIALGIAVTLAVGMLRNKSVGPDPLQQLKERYAKKAIPSVDHSKLAILQKKFSSPQEVTTTCISCHTERGKEVLGSSHWNWEREEYIEGHGIRSIGKKNILNNFCIGVSGNLDACDKCHVGYGFVDTEFDFQEEKNIDCLSCHDNSSTYVKTGKGMPAASVDLNYVAQHVGNPQRENCGTCHFFSGGGNNVKHGDLDKSLFNPSREVDVHMASEGSNLQCVDCHTAENHKMLGKLYSVSSMNRDRSTCEQCHTAILHEDNTLNEHTLKVACQTCHIPTYAKVNATKTAWDWSTAGTLSAGQQVNESDSLGNPTYMSKKGTFTWGRNIKPEYIWFNGTAGHYFLGDTVSAEQPIQVNTLHGSYDDPEAKIIPVKIHRAKQIYDPVTKMLIQPKLVAAKKGEGAFWKDFDWNHAAEEGMKSLGLPYSGEHTFEETVMTWPINHMVAPKEKTVQCVECHTRTNSRLANLSGFYMPGRDSNFIVEILGKAAIVIVIFLVMLHSAARVTVRIRNRKEQA